MLTRTYLKDLDVTIKEDYLEVYTEFRDVRGNNVAFGKRIEIREPLKATVINDFFEDVLMEIAWRKISPMSELTRSLITVENKNDGN
jgi:hypothetical protein